MADKVKVILPDGSKKEYSSGITISEIIRDTNPTLSKSALAAFLNGRMVDLSEKVTADSEIGIITFDSKEGKGIFWHSTSHIMAQAVQDVFPEIKLDIGPSIDEGFYYDFDTPRPFEPEDLIKIEKRMGEIVKENLPFRRKDVGKKEAVEFFQQKGEKYKVARLSEMDEEKVSLYQHNSFVDLCRGPHIPSTGIIRSFKLLSIAGAYWKGSEKNPMLQRIYGISFPSPGELDEYLKRLEELKKRDHRVLGKELELFSISEDVGPGLILWHPKGAQIRRVIEDFWINEHQKNGYQLIYTPHVARFHL
jgi:threonyl-tRNA synthetase